MSRAVFNPIPARTGQPFLSSSAFKNDAAYGDYIESKGCIDAPTQVACGSHFGLYFSETNLLLIEGAKFRGGTYQ